MSRSDGGHGKRESVWGGAFVSLPVPTGSLSPHPFPRGWGETGTMESLARRAGLASPHIDQSRMAPSAAAVSPWRREVESLRGCCGERLGKRLSQGRNWGKRHWHSVLLQADSAVEATCSSDRSYVHFSHVIALLLLSLVHRFANACDGRRLNTDFKPLVTAYGRLRSNANGSKQPQEA